MAEREEPLITADGTAGDVAASAGPADPADPVAADLVPLRERIDAIDRAIVALLNERAQMALEIGRLKEEAGRRPVRDPRREEQVIEHVTSVSAGLFPEPELVALYRRLIAATRRVQHAQRRVDPSRPGPLPRERPRRPSALPSGDGAAEQAVAAKGAAPDPPPDAR